jgi:hypothetical protein
MGALFELPPNVGGIVALRLRADVRAEGHDPPSGATLLRVLRGAARRTVQRRADCRRGWPLVVRGGAGRYGADCCRRLLRCSACYFAHLTLAHGASYYACAEAIRAVYQGAEVIVYQDMASLAVSGVWLGPRLPFIDA